MKKPTRDDCLNGYVTASEYYRAVALDVVLDDATVKQASKYSFGGASSALWDEFAKLHSGAIQKALELHGDAWSVYTGAKVLKAVGRRF
jgi:hypothetical protein